MENKKTKEVLLLLYLLALFTMCLGSHVKRPLLGLKVTTDSNDETQSGGFVTYRAQVSHVSQSSKAAAINIEMKFFLQQFAIFHSFITVHEAPKSVTNGSTLVIKYDRLNQSRSIEFVLKTQVDHLRGLEKGAIHNGQTHVWMTYNGEHDKCLRSGVDYPGTTAENHVEFYFYAPLACEQHLDLKESQVFATSWSKINSSTTQQHAPHNARIHGNGFWTPIDRFTLDRSQYYEVDFRYKVTLTSILIQGSNGSTAFIKTFTIHHTLNGIKWKDYKEDGYIKVFQANKDSATVKRIHFTRQLKLRYLRIKPLQWHLRIALRANFSGCKHELLDQALGVSSGTIPDNRITASSTNSTFEARFSRLDSQLGGGGWCAGVLDTNQYLEIDLGSLHVVTQVAVQPRFGSPLYSVLTYLVDYSTDKSSWITYNHNGTNKVFTGSSVDHFAVKQTFLQPVTARYVRFKPKTYLGKMCMRCEVYGKPQTGSVKVTVPPLKQSLMVDEKNGNVFVCLIHYRRDKTNCFVATNSGTSWTAMPLTVLSLIGFNQNSSELYGLSHKQLYLKTRDVFTDGWHQILETVYENEKGNLSFPTEAPMMPIVEPLAFEQPLSETLWTDNLGGQWGVSLSGVHYKSGSDAWRMVAIWQTEDVHECNSSPCINGECTENGTSFTCQCIVGFKGKYCEENIDDCGPDSCQNGGTCIDGVNIFTCKCLPSSSGIFCEEVRSICNNDQPCANDGKCTDGLFNYTCQCNAGTMGHTCAIEFDNCYSEPCQSGGECINKANDYYCACPTGYEGKNCESGRGFHVVKTTTVTYKDKQFLAISATLGASGRSVNSSWCEDYYWLCKANTARPVGCGRSFRNDSRIRKCRDDYKAVMLTGDPVGCGSTDLIAAVAQAAGFTTAANNNSFAFGRCQDVCPYQLHPTNCVSSLPCLKLTPDYKIFTICSKLSDSNFVVHDEKDLFHYNTTYKLLKVDALTSQRSLHENWCRDYQKLCESYGLRPLAFGKSKEYTENFGTPGQTYHAIVEKDMRFTGTNAGRFSLLAKLAGFKSASASNTFTIRYTEDNHKCVNNIPTNGHIHDNLYQFAYGYRSRLFTVCTDGASISSLKVLDSREVTFKTISFLALQVNVSRQVGRKNWCKEYQDLCDSFNLQPVGCSMNYKHVEYTQCRDDFRAMTSTSDVLGCPPHNKAVTVLQMAGFSESNTNNSFVFDRCDQCRFEDVSQACRADIVEVPCVGSKLNNEVAYTLCAETEGAFSVISSSKTSRENVPFLVLHVRYPKNGLSKYNNWCTEYKKLCALYSLSPTGCGTAKTAAAYVDCANTYSSYRPVDNILGCSPASVIVTIAKSAGYKGVTQYQSFGFTQCQSYCTNTLTTSSCYTALDCLKINLAAKREAYTVCQGPPLSFGGISDEKTTTYNGEKYHVFKLQLPADGKSLQKNWCKEYQMFCKSYGLRPTGCGKSQIEEEGFRTCRDTYDSFMSDTDDLGCDSRLKVSQIAVQAGFMEATTQNSFAFYNCSDCPRVLPSSGCTGGLYCLNRGITGAVYSVCRDSDSGFIVHETKQILSRGTNFLVLKTETPKSVTSKYSNWCIDYQKLCWSYGKLPTGVSEKYLYTATAESMCKSYYNSVMLRKRSQIAQNPEGDIKKLVEISKIKSFLGSNNYFAFKECNTDCPNTLPGACMSQLYCLQSYPERIQHTVCVDPDSNFHVIDKKNYTHFGRKYLVIHASIPENGISKHENWCKDYQRLCQSFVMIPVTCGSESWRKKDYYECRDEYGSALYDEHALRCDSNDDSVGIAQDAGFRKATTANTIIFHNCRRCSKYLTTTPSESVYPLAKSTRKIYALCTDSNSNFQVLRTRKGQHKGQPHTALLLRTPKDGYSKHENWCRDYERLCATYGQQPTGCGRAQETSSPYSLCKQYNSSMPIDNTFGCTPNDEMKKAIYNVFKTATTSNTFGFHTCEPSHCSNLLPSSVTSPALYHASLSDSYYVKHTVCVDRSTAFQYVQHASHDKDSTNYLVIKASLPANGKSSFENWCRDYEKLCSIFGRRPLACGRESIIQYKYRSCRDEYNAVMQSGNTFGCGPNSALLAEIAKSAGYTAATASNVFAMRKCGPCSDTIPTSGVNKHLYNINMGVANREVYAFCVHSDSNFQVRITRPVVYAAKKYLAVKVKMPSSRTSQHENWCRDYQRMCESFGKRPVAPILSEEYVTLALDCRLSYNAFFPDAGRMWSNVPYTHVHTIAQKAELGEGDQHTAFAFYRCGTSCRKSLHGNQHCQDELHCFANNYLIDGEGYTVCADTGSGFEVIVNKTIDYNGTEYLVVMASVPSHGQPRFENWCRDYQKLCESYGRRPLGCGNIYRHDSQHTRCRDVYNALMFYNDTSSCKQNEKVADIAKYAGFPNANENNSFAFNSCEKNDCLDIFGKRFTRAFYNAGTDPTNQEVYTVCVNSDSKFDIILAKPKAYSSYDFLVVKAKIPSDGKSKYENWCRDYERLCDSYGMRPTGSDHRSRKLSAQTSCRENYRSIMAPTAIISSPPQSNVRDSIVVSLAETASSTNTFAFDKCLEQDCLKSLPASSCSSSLSCISQNVPNRIVHTVCTEPSSNFKVLDHRNIRYMNRNFLVLKAMIKEPNASSKANNWCADYETLCKSYGKQALACPHSRASAHEYHRCRDEFHAVLMESSECPLNSLIADIAITAGFSHATERNSFAFRSCNESACVKYLIGSGCDNALYCISRTVPNREVYTVCTDSDTNFEVIQTVVSSDYLVMKVRLPKHGKSLHENWCKDYQVLCESFGRRPAGCGISSKTNPDYRRCTTRYNSYINLVDKFGCKTTTQVANIAKTAGFTGVTAQNSFIFRNCSDAACSRDLTTAQCHESLYCLNGSLLNREVFAICHTPTPIAETNLKAVLQTKWTVYQGVSYFVIKAQLPPDRSSKAPNWCMEYKQLCKTYGLKPTGCGKNFSGDAKYSSCSSTYGSVMLPGNNLDCDPRVMVSVIARNAGFYNATYNNSFAFHSCSSGDCSSSLPASACSPSLSCAGGRAKHLEVHTVCTDITHSNFEVMDSAYTEHNGMNYLALKARIPADGISLKETWCNDYKGLCEFYNGRPIGCGEANASNPNISSCRSTYDSFMPSSDNLGCNSSLAAIQIINAAGLAGVNSENTFVFYQCDNASCTKELPNEQCSNSLHCINKNVLFSEVFTLCLANQQHHNFEVIKTTEAKYNGWEYQAIEVRMPDNKRSKYEDWCRDYQRLCESFGMRPMGHQNTTSFHRKCHRYNQLVPPNDRFYSSLELAINVLHQAGISSASAQNTFAFDSCSLEQCPNLLDHPDCHRSTTSFCKLNQSFLAYTVCAIANSTFKVLETRNAVYNGLKFDVLKARIPTNKESKARDWCLDYQQICASYGLRPVAQNEVDLQYSSGCQENYDAIKIQLEDENHPYQLATVAGFTKASLINSFSFSRCTNKFCGAVFNSDTCGTTFNCLHNNKSSLPNDFYFICIKDIPPSNFEVISTKVVELNQEAHLAIHARIPSHGKSQNEDWCRDYQKLCESHSLKPLACNRDEYESSNDKALCLAKYDAVMPIDSTLECPARSQVKKLVQLAGFNQATLDNSFALHSCTACSRLLNSSSDQGLFGISLTPQRDVYTVCTRDYSFNFEVLETRLAIKKGFEFLIIRLRLPRFTVKSKQSSWCKDYQLLCESYGRRPLGDAYLYQTSDGSDDCTQQYNAYMIPNDALTTDLRSGMVKLTNNAGFLRANHKTTFYLHNCKLCKDTLDKGCDNQNSGVFCLEDSLKSIEKYTVCI